MQVARRQRHDDNWLITSLEGEVLLQQKTGELGVMAAAVISWSTEQIHIDIISFLQVHSGDHWQVVIIWRRPWPANFSAIHAKEYGVINTRCPRECSKAEIISAIDWGSEHASCQVHCSADVQLLHLVWNNCPSWWICRIPLDVKGDATSCCFDVQITNRRLVFCDNKIILNSNWHH